MQTADSKTETKHTPGPWLFAGFKRASNFADHVAIVQADHCNLVSVRGGVSDDRAVAEANARLIAAAPDLLAICQAVELHCQGEGVGYGPEHRAEGVRLRAQMRAAIAKASL